MNGPLKKYHMSKYLLWAAMGIILVSTALLRISMLQIPLERDEGEYAYMGQLLLQGIPPYLSAYTMKLPGTCAIYALIMGIFGQSVFAIHLGLLIFNGIAIVLVFLITRYLADEIAGLAAALSYALLSVIPSFLGSVAHATQFLAPFALGGIFLLLKAIDERKTLMLAAGGLLLGSAFLIKQHAIFFIFFAILYYLIRMMKMSAAKRETAYGTAILIISSALPFMTVCALFYMAGIFSKFWFWTFTYPIQYVSEIPLSMAGTMFLNTWTYHIHPCIWVLLIAGIGLSSVFWDEETRRHRDFWAGFFVFSSLSVCPGFYFRPHYFVTLLPALAMLSGIAVRASMIYLSDRFSPHLKAVPVVFFIIAIGIPAWPQTRFFFANPVDASRMLYITMNPFPESLAVAQYIKNHSSETDTIAVIGSEPQIYFYANRKSATGYIYICGLMEPHVYALQMQKEMAREIESAKPRYIVFVHAQTSWNTWPDSNFYILDWSKKYLDDYYLIRGFIKIGSDLKIKTDMNPREIRQMIDNSLLIMERKQQ